MTYEVTVRVIKTLETRIEIQAKDEGAATYYALRAYRLGELSESNMLVADSHVEADVAVVPEGK